MIRNLFFWMILLSGLHFSSYAQDQPKTGPTDKNGRPTGHVLDTSTYPFLLTSDGKTIGDPFPVYWDGVWHLYALSVDFNTILHFTSTDLVRWTEHKPAMVGRDICTGTILRHGKQYYFFYTDAKPQAIRLVISDNPWEFDFSKSMLVAEADGNTYRKNTGFFRDVYVFFNEDEKLWWMLIEARFPEVCTGLLKSEDLLSWTRFGPIFRDKSRVYGSCPQIFKQGKLWYLACQDWYNWYYTAGSPYGPWINRGPYLSVAIEAASRFATDGKRQLTWGWLANFEQTRDTPAPENVYPPTMKLLNYGGPLCIGREMVFNGDGTMDVRPLPELLAAIRKEKGKTDLFSCARALSGAWRIDPRKQVFQCTSANGGTLLIDLPGKNPNIYFEAEMHVDSPRTNVSVITRSSGTADSGYSFNLRPADKKIAILRLKGGSGREIINDKKFIFPTGKSLGFQIFVCDNNMEAFIDGRECLSACLSDRSGYGIAIKVTGSGTIREPFVHYFRND